MVSTLTLIFAVGALWFANGWYLNEKLREVHGKLDLLNGQINGLREYLYEIDPQFDDERVLLRDLYSSVDAGRLSFAGMEHLELVRKKKADGLRTLHTPFLHEEIT